MNTDKLANGKKNLNLCSVTVKHNDDIKNSLINLSCYVIELSDDTRDALVS